MEIIESKSKGRIELVINLKGDIIYVRPGYEAILKQLKLGKNISKLIDVDYIQKVSMFSNRIDVVTVNHSVYKQAIISVFSRGYGKFIKVCFFDDFCDKTESDWIVDKKIVGIVGEVVENKEAKNVDLPHFLGRIKEIVKEDYYFLNVFCDNIKMYTYESVLQALILNGVAIMNEIYPTKPVDLYVKRLSDGIQIKLVLNVDKNIKASTWQQVEKKFPCISLRVSIMDEACKNTNIYNRVQISNGFFYIDLVVGEIKETESALYTRPMADIMRIRIAQMLKPRKYILTRYGKQVKGLEE